MLERDFDSFKFNEFYKTTYLQKVPTMFVLLVVFLPPTFTPVKG